MRGKVKLSDFAGALTKKTALLLESRVKDLRQRSRQRAERVREMLS